MEDICCWNSSTEWISVRNAIYLEDTFRDIESKNWAAAKMSAWMSRGPSAPPEVEATKCILDGIIADSDESSIPYSATSAAACYSHAILRFISILTPPGESLTNACDALGIPQEILEVRNAVAHRDVPSLPRLRYAAEVCLSFLRVVYWESESTDHIWRSSLISDDNSDDAFQSSFKILKFCTLPSIASVVSLCATSATATAAQPSTARAAGAPYVGKFAGGSEESCDGSSVLGPSLAVWSLLMDAALRNQPLRELRPRIDRIASWNGLLRAVMSGGSDPSKVSANFFNVRKRLNGNVGKCPTLSKLSCSISFDLLRRFCSRLRVGSCLAMDLADGGALHSAGDDLLLDFISDVLVPVFAPSSNPLAVPLVAAALSKVSVNGYIRLANRLMKKLLDPSAPLDSESGGMKIDEFLKAGEMRGVEGIDLRWRCLEWIQHCLAIAPRRHERNEWLVILADAKADTEVPDFLRSCSVNGEISREMDDWNCHGETAMDIPQATDLSLIALWLEGRVGIASEAMLSMASTFAETLRHSSSLYLTQTMAAVVTLSQRRNTTSRANALIGAIAWTFTAIGADADDWISLCNGIAMLKPPEAKFVKSSKESDAIAADEENCDDLAAEVENSFLVASGVFASHREMKAIEKRRQLWSAPGTFVDSSNSGLIVDTDYWA